MPLDGSQGQSLRWGLPEEKLLGHFKWDVPLRYQEVKVRRKIAAHSSERVQAGAMFAHRVVIKAMVWGRPLSGEERGMWPSALRNLGISWLRRGKESEPARQMGKEQPDRKQGRSEDPCPRC